MNAQSWLRITFAVQYEYGHIHTYNRYIQFTILRSINNLNMYVVLFTQFHNVFTILLRQYLTIIFWKKNIYILLDRWGRLKHWNLKQMHRCLLTTYTIYLLHISKRPYVFSIMSMYLFIDKIPGSSRLRVKYTYRRIYL